MALWWATKQDLQETEARLAADLNALRAAVEANASAINSAVVALQNLRDAFESAGIDPAEMQAIIADINAGANMLSQAVIDNGL